ncbi:MAG: hypothetical protein J5564_05935, partial [Clostridia bacterium]|nr:hypothetical protein [Clostridia bacterium]
PATPEPHYTIPVTCVDENGNIITSYTRDCGAGSTVITAENIDGYDMDPGWPGQVEVIVTADGANVQEVTFRYIHQATPVPATDTPVPATPEPHYTIPVTCMDEQGNIIAFYSRECVTGSNMIAAEPIEGYDMDPGYPFQAEVIVTDGQVSMQGVTFHYVRRIGSVTVPVYCMDENGSIIVSYTRDCGAGSTVITAETIDGYDMDPSWPGQAEVIVTADGANVQDVTFRYMRQATPVPATETPVPSTPTPEPHYTVPVIYVDSHGNQLTRYDAEVQPGDNMIVMDPDRVSSVNKQYGESTVRVSVSPDGTCDPDQVIFTFIAPLELPVYYRDFNGNDVADPQIRTCTAGTNMITSDPVNLTEGYILADNGNKYVYVDEKGAADENGQPITEIQFTYGSQTAPDQPTATPEPRLVLVPVTYRTTTGDQPFYVDNTVKCFTGDNTVEADPAHVPEGYKPEGPTSVQVTVDAEGNASPSSVEFVYNVSDMTRPVMVYYRNAAGADMVPPQSVYVGIGSRQIHADLSLIPEGWQVDGDAVRDVYLQEDGTLDPEYVTFTLTEIPATTAPTDSPRPTAEPADYPMYDMDAYCYPRTDDVAILSFPGEADSSRQIARAKLGDLMHIDGYVVNSLNETWYIATLGDQTGYVRDTQIRVLTQEEVNALFGTPVPATATPAPETLIPDGTFIDRWGALNLDNVNFRADTSTRSDVLGRYKKNQRIFIYDSVTVDGEKWYRARINDRDGFMMAKYIDLMSQAESDAYQQTLTSPMPVRTLPPTEVPATPTPTAVPVTPTPTASPTPTPPSYSGYALTTRTTDLRTGANTEDTTLSTLPANTLVYLYGQGYVEGVCWNSAQVLSSNISGYIQDSALRRISAEEAAPYLNALQPQTQPPQPTQVPDLYSGYGVTRGGYVMIRTYADDKAEIAQVLTEGEVVWVMRQEYVSGSPYYWEVVQYGQTYGYVRSDQLRMMDYQEQADYINSLRTPVPTMEITVTIPPITQTSMSSYGYVTTNNVRLRNGPSRQDTQIKLMSQYAFALVLGTENVNGEIWYHISQAGTEGYVMGSYFRVLSLGELSEFLASDAYLQSAANTGDDSSVSGSGLPGTGITSVEDFNTGVWKNPNLVNVTYEPFSNIIASPTPDVEQVTTISPAPSESPSPTPVQTSTSTVDLTVFTTPVPNTKTSGRGWIWAGIAAVAVLGGGAAYGYSIYRANQRRQAQRAAQRRQAQQQQQQSGYSRPSQQTARPQGKSGQQAARVPYQQSTTTQHTSVFTPPRTQTADKGDTNVYAPPRTGSTGSTARPGSGNASGAGTGTQQPDSSTPARKRRSDRHKS